MTEQTELDVSVEEVTHAVAEITKMDVVIAELHQKYDKVIFDVDTTDGMNSAKEARKEIREPRYLIENLRKEGKRPILALGRQLDARAGEMTDRLMAIETPIQDTIKEEETRLERERQVKIEAETKRVEDIQGRIASIREHAVAALQVGITKANIEQSITDIEIVDIDDSFDEFREQADDARTATLATLREIFAAFIKREKEDERIANERKELAKLRAEAEEREAKAADERAEADRKAREKREAEEKAERDKLEKQRKDQEKKQAEIDKEKKQLADEKVKREGEAEAERKRIAKAKADAKKVEFPGTPAIIKALCGHFDVTETVVKKWLKVLK